MMIYDYIHNFALGMLLGVLVTAFAWYLTLR